MGEAKEIDVQERNARALTLLAADSDSEAEVLRAAGIGIAEDDPTEPILTLRMWVLGIGFCMD
jgi:hypothetical protein